MNSISQAIRNEMKSKYRQLELYCKFYTFSPYAHSELLLNIMLFDGRVQHGGLVDRLKGIISTYLLLDTIGLAHTFRIVHYSPYLLEKYLCPNEFNWSMGKEPILNHYPSSRVVYHLDDFRFNQFRKKVLLNNQRSRGQNHIYVNIDFVKNMGRDNERKWVNTFDKLFKPSELLINLLSKYEQSAPVGIHARFASLLGDFKDSTSKILASSKDREIVIKCCLFAIKRIIADNPGKQFYLFSDSHQFVRKALDVFPFLQTTEGQAIHIDTKINIDARNTSHDKTWIDFFLLTNCDKIYLLKGPDMYKSQFSKYAALIGGSTYEIVELSE